MDQLANESPQALIEKEMQRIISLGNYEMAHLFSEEGLPLAEAKIEDSMERDRLIEISVYFQDIKHIADMLGGMSSLKEIIMEGENARKVAFRFFKAFEQTVVLVVVIPPRKTYRKWTNHMVRLIQAVSGQ